MAGALLEAIGNTAFGQVVRRQLDQDFVADEHADAILAHFAGGMAKDLVIVFEPNAEHCVGEQLHNLTAQFKQFFLCQNNPIGMKKSRGPLLRNRAKGKMEALSSHPRPLHARTFLTVSCRYGPQNA